jgi:hypothetical protein
MPVISIETSEEADARAIEQAKSEKDAELLRESEQDVLKFQSFSCAYLTFD